MIEDVTVPKRVFNLEQGKIPTKEDKTSAEYWDAQAKAARARREFLEEQQLQEKITNPQDPPETPFKLKGEVNLGTIDFQEQQRKAQEAQELARTEAQERVAKAEQERDEARKALSDANMTHLRLELGGKIEQLQTAIAENNKTDIAQQLMGIEKLAGMLGYQKPEPGATDSALSLEIKKLEFQMQRENRDFQRQMKADDRRWQIELKKLEQSAKDSDTKLQIEREKLRSMSNIPERLGAVITQGLMGKADGVDDGGDGDEAITPKQTSRFVAEANEGEAGELVCPTCSTPIGIGPTTKLAKCVNCQTKVTVERLPVEANAPPA